MISSVLLLEIFSYFILLKYCLFCSRICHFLAICFDFTLPFSSEYTQHMSMRKFSVSELNVFQRKVERAYDRGCEPFKRTLRKTMITKWIIKGRKLLITNNRNNCIRGTHLAECHSIAEYRIILRHFLQLNIEEKVEAKRERMKKTIEAVQYNGFDGGLHMACGRQLPLRERERTETMWVAV